MRNRFCASFRMAENAKRTPELTRKVKNCNVPRNKIKSAIFWQKSYRLEWYLIICHYLNLYVHYISFITRLFLLWKLTGAKSNFETMCLQERNLFGNNFSWARLLLFFFLFAYRLVSILVQPKSVSIFYLFRFKRFPPFAIFVVNVAKSEQFLQTGKKFQGGLISWCCCNQNILICWYSNYRNYWSLFQIEIFLNKWKNLYLKLIYHKI